MSEPSAYSSAVQRTESDIPAGESATPPDPFDTFVDQVFDADGNYVPPEEREAALFDAWGDDEPDPEAQDVYGDTEPEDALPSSPAQAWQEVFQWAQQASPQEVDAYTSSLTPEQAQVLEPGVRPGAGREHDRPD